jgi:large subunit ribosomal protein L16
MLLPKKVKHRKWHKLKSSGLRPATTKLTLSFGEFGLKALTPAWVTSRQIEAARRAMSRTIKRGGKIWIRIFPDKPVTTKGLEVPMGGGKGSVDHYVAIVRAGTVVFEMDGVPLESAREAMRLAAHKMPFRSRFITKHD